jgi:hypothetical protein
VLNGCGQRQFEDISEKLVGLPSAEVLRLMAEHKAFVAKVIGQEPEVPIP